MKKFFLCFFLGFHDYETHQELLSPSYPTVIYRCKRCNKLKREWL